MTETEIAKALHKQESTVREAIRRTAKILPSVDKKFINGCLYCGTEFTLEETKEIYRQLKCNELQIILLEENWIEKPQKDVYTIKGTLEYLEEFKKNPRIKCCNTCKYLLGKTDDIKMPRPFCSLYNRYLHNFNAKVYEDYCSSYTYINLPKPRQWFKDNAPHNLNMYGETNTVNGIDRKKLDVQRKKNDPIIIVNQVGFDY